MRRSGERSTKCGFQVEFYILVHFVGMAIRLAATRYLPIGAGSLCPSRFVMPVLNLHKTGCTVCTQKNWMHRNSALSIGQFRNGMHMLRFGPVTYPRRRQKIAKNCDANSPKHHWQC